MSIHKGDSTISKFLKRLAPTQLAAILHEGYLNKERVGKTLRKAAAPAAQLAAIAALHYGVRQAGQAAQRHIDRELDPAALTEFLETARAEDSWMDEAADLTNDLPQGVREHYRDRNFNMNAIQAPLEQPYRTSRLSPRLMGPYIQPNVRFGNYRRIR